MKFLGLIILLLPQVSLAQSIYASWGIGYNDKKSEIDDKIKWAEFGDHEQYKILDTKLGVGGWTDVNTGTRNAVYAHYLAGLETRKREGIYISYMLGPALISNTDVLLGSNLQCSHEAEIGYRDSREIKVRIDIKHMSNAGVVRPNQGRNFVGIGLEARL